MKYANAIKVVCLVPLFVVLTTSCGDSSSQTPAKQVTEPKLLEGTDIRGAKAQQFVDEVNRQKHLPKDSSKYLKAECWKVKVGDLCSILWQGETTHGKAVGKILKAGDIQITSAFEEQLPSNTGTPPSAPTP